MRPAELIATPSLIYGTGWFASGITRAGRCG